MLSINPRVLVRGVRHGMAILLSSALMAPIAAAQSAASQTESQPQPQQQQQQPAPQQQQQEQQQPQPAQTQEKKGSQAQPDTPAKPDQPASQSPQQTSKTAEPGTADAKKDTKVMGSSMIIDAEELAKNPSKYYGRKVMIQPADVNRVISQHAFLLDEDALFAGPDILVIVPSPSGAVAKDAEVRITGTVRPYVEAEIERDFNWFSADSIEIELKDRPVVIAESVQSADGREFAGAIARSPQPTPQREQAMRVTAGQLAANPEQFVGSRVTLRAEVEAVYNRQLFTLDEDRMFAGPDVIVYARDGRVIVQDDEMVTVTGRVHKFIETDLFKNATWFEPWFRDIDEAGRGLFRSRPVIVVDSVQSMAGAQLYSGPSERMAGSAKPEQQTASPAEKTAAAQPSQSARETASPSGATGAPEQAREEGAAGTAGSESSSGMEIGSQVTMSGTIQSMATDRAFWLNVEGRPEPLMVIVDASRMADMADSWKPGVDQKVTVSGTVREVPGQSGAVTVTEWGLQPQDAERFRKQRVYLYADNVSPQQQQQ